MRSTPPLTIEIAQLPGGNGPSEDRVFVTPNAVIVLDGATQIRKLERDGGWIAQQLGQRLADHLTREPEAPPVDVLERSLVDLVAAYDLEPRSAPSTTVNMARLTNCKVDVLVLCDSPVAVQLTDRRIQVVRDDRLQNVLRSIQRPPGRRNMRDPAWQRAVAQFEARRNARGGFWVASADPQAAREAITRSFPLEDVVAVVSMTDGIAIGMDEYRSPPSWEEAITLATTVGPQTLVDLVHATEVLDADCTRWPRTKPHDDKALAVLRPEQVA